MYSIKVIQQFCAAHRLPGIPICENLHGHTWKVEIEIQSPNLPKDGMLFNFSEIKEWMKKMLPDHRYMNEVYPFSSSEFPPTAENIAYWLYNCAVRRYSMVRKVTVWESDTACASYWEE